MNQLYYGDNLHVLRDRASFPDESVDLIYLDPPFNSQRDYNLLFKSPKGHESEAQITAFEDSWHWGEQAEREFDEIIHGKNTDLASIMNALRSFLGENDMMAYLTMMANRLLELHRVLKTTGSIYLHCDPTASHYLKVVMDGVFGKENYRNEIIWSYRRWPSPAKNFQWMHDSILFYTKKPKANTFHVEYEANSDSYTKRFKGKTQVLDEETKTRKLVVDAPSKGLPRRDVWEMSILAGSSNERLGYPTQKPLALLERIIAASSNEGDVVLDPFCGCGTAVHAAQNLKRKWIGIDITHLAISLIEKRLRGAFKNGLVFEVHGTPKDLDAARDLAMRDKYQFQWWAVSLVEAQPFQGKKKGADGGIDGLKFFHDVDKAGVRKIVVSVKGGGLKADDVRALNHVREREKADFAFLISIETPTKGMVGDAASAGLFVSASGKKYPRVQLLTIERLLEGKQRGEHPDYTPDLNFKKAKAENTDEQVILPLEEGT